jgi:hypothetical protein
MDTPAHGAGPGSAIQGLRDHVRIDVGLLVVAKYSFGTHATLEYRWWSPPTRGSATTLPPLGGWRARLARRDRATCEIGPRCTTPRETAHRNELKRVHYPWHPWFGREVSVYAVRERGGVIVLCCKEEDTPGRGLEVAAWVFDPVYYAKAALTATPLVPLTALRALQDLLAKRTAIDVAAENRPPDDGGADAKPKATCRYPDEFLSGSPQQPAGRSPDGEPADADCVARATGGELPPPSKRRRV